MKTKEQTMQRNAQRELKLQNLLSVSLLETFEHDEFERDELRDTQARYREAHTRD
jgi:hypothetical protein